MNGAQGIAAVILIFLEQAEGDWVAVTDLARLLALDEARVAEELQVLKDYAPSADLALRMDAQNKVIAASLGNGALEVA